MARPRKSFTALLAGCLLAAFAFMAGTAGFAGAVYPPAPSPGLGPVTISGGDGDAAAGQEVTTCGAAGAADAGAAFTLVVGSTTIASGTADGDGSYCATGTIPSGLPAGTYVVTFSTTKNGAPVEATSSFSVKADGTFGVDVTPGPGAGLPRTGSNTAGLVRTAAVLMAAGAGMLVVLAVRRRSDASA